MVGYILSHDLGTTGDKAVLFDLGENAIAASTFVGYPTTYPWPTWAEQDPRNWLRAFVLGTRHILRASKVKTERIEAVSFSGQMLGCLGVDGRGAPLAPSIIWMDQRSVKQAQCIRERIGERAYYEITGNRISPTYTVSKILWVKENKPRLYRRARKFLQAKDYIAFILTGNYCTDYSDASLSGMFDITKRRWAYPMIEELGIDVDKLPDAHASTDVVGEVLEDMAAKVGLSSGTPVIIGGGDGPCAAVGAGVVRPGLAYIYLGASSWIAVCSDKPLLDPKMRIFNQWHLDPEKVSPTGTMQAAGNSYRWLRDEICAPEKGRAAKAGKSPYAVMDSEAERVKLGSGKIVFLPYLMGERSPRWNQNARGVFFGLALGHTRKDLIRAVLEGVGYNLKTILNALEETGNDIGRIMAIGGGARSKLWRQILSDILGKRLAISQYPEEATSVGAAISGAVGIGFYRDFSVAEKLVRTVDEDLPNAKNYRRYAAYHDIFEKLYKCLEPLYDGLATIDD